MMYLNSIQLYRLFMISGKDQLNYFYLAFSYIGKLESRALLVFLLCWASYLYKVSIGTYVNI